MVTPARMELLRRLFGGGRSGIERSVVVVSGLPRSGTSMLMGMLAGEYAARG